MILVGPDWIAARLGVSRRYVCERITKAPGFPRPRVETSRKMRRWAVEDVEAWIEWR